MSEDVEMDAPQISTLRDEESPEPPLRTAAPKLRVKLLLGDAKRSTSIKSKTSNAEPSEEEEEEEDEEDQLIDDDEDEKPTPVAPTPPTTSARSSTTSSKRGGPRTRGGAGGKRRNAKADTAHKTTTPLVEGWIPDSPSGSAAQGPQPATKKRAAPKGGAQRTVKKRAPKTAKAIPPNLRDDAGSLSEAYAATAASSPLPHDEHTPEPEHPPIPVPVHVNAQADEITLEGVPLPVYPLPSKPFPVQPPLKIGSGFAPVIPLDRSGRTVRKWRQANREIRGIAGGRWFAKTWIGDKESEFATAAAAAAAAAHAAAAQAAVESAAAALSGMSGMNLSKLTMAGISGTASGKATPRFKALKADAGLATGPSSRAASAGPESISAQLGSRKRGGIAAAETPIVSTPAP